MTTNLTQADVVAAHKDGDPVAMDADAVSTCTRPQRFPAFQTIVYLVAAYHRFGNYWKVFRESGADEYLNEEAAKNRASQLSSVWTDRLIIKINLRGTG